MKLDIARAFVLFSLGLEVCGNWEMQVSGIEFSDFGQTLPVPDGEYAVAKFHRARSPQRLQRAIDGHERHSQRVAELSLVKGQMERSGLLDACADVGCGDAGGAARQPMTTSPTL